MGNYTKSTDFAIKDNLGITNPAKVIKGAEFDAEFNAIQNAVNDKAESVNSNLTGTTQIAALRLAGVDVTATSAELNKLDGVTASTAEINTLVGVTSPIQTQIDTKFGSAGGTVTGNITLEDNIGLRLGTNADLVMFSDGSDSFITEQGANGSLFVKSNGDGIIFRDAANANYASMLQATGEVKLFHIDTGVASTRLTTSSTGVTVNGETATTTLNLGGTAVTATAAEINHVSGVTSAVQDQIDAKAPVDNPTFTTDVTVPSISLGDWDITLSTNDIVFSYLGTPKFKLATTGELTASDDLTAFGTL